MYRRKLKALGHHHPESFDVHGKYLKCAFFEKDIYTWLYTAELQYKGFLFPITDEDEFRNLVVWLEDQKIRWYKIEDRGELRDVKSSEWLKTFAKVVCITLRRGWNRGVNLPSPYFPSQFLPPPYFLSQFLPPP